MRVGVNTLFLLPEEVGGSEVYLRRLVSAFSATAPRLDMVFFTNLENHDTFQDHERVPIGVRAESRARRILAEQMLLPRAALKAKVDLLWSPGYTAPLRCRVPQVVTIHDVQFRAFPGDFSVAALVAHRILVGGAARAARVILTDSQFSRGEITRCLGAPDAKIIVAHAAPGHGTEPSIQPGFDRPFILNVSNTYPHKNAKRLVSAFIAIADKIQHDLVMIGQPRGGEPPSHPRVRRLHRVAPAELMGMYEACDLFVFPSMYEGFGLPVVEAMAAGARIVASNAAAIPEIAGECATYFDPTNENAIAGAIIDAVNEEDAVRRKYKTAARARSDLFKWEKCAESTVKAFQLAIEGQGSEKGL